MAERTQAARGSARGPDWLTGLGTAAVGQVAGRAAALPQLRRRALQDIPWTPLRRPVAEATVALVSTAGVHLATDPPFDIRGDGSFRVIPRDAVPGDLVLTHPAYDRRDAQRDLNLVLPLERLRELESEGVIGRVARDHYGFGLSPDDHALTEPGREMACRLTQEQVDLALLVPA
jgi:D-proline reductase (dithiol) PrdB